VRFRALEVAGLAQDARQQGVRVRLAGIRRLARQNFRPFDIPACKSGLRRLALCRRNADDPPQDRSI